MYKKKNREKQHQLQFITLDDLVPQNHILRLIDEAIQYLFDIRSMRQTIREIEVNTAYIWFIGYDLLEPIPHFSTFNKNYTRRFRDTDILNVFFSISLTRLLKMVL